MVANGCMESSAYLFHAEGLAAFLQITRTFVLSQAINIFALHPIKVIHQRVRNQASPPVSLENAKAGVFISCIKSEAEG